MHKAIWLFSKIWYCYVDLSKTLCDYYTLVKILPETNQFGEGLDTVRVLSMIRKHPGLMKQIFTDCEYKPINKGIMNHGSGS